MLMMFLLLLTWLLLLRSPRRGGASYSGAASAVHSATDGERLVVWLITHPTRGARPERSVLLNVPPVRICSLLVAALLLLLLPAVKPLRVSIITWWLSIVTW